MYIKKLQVSISILIDHVWSIEGGSKTTPPPYIGAVFIFSPEEFLKKCFHFKSVLMWACKVVPLMLNLAKYVNYISSPFGLINFFSSGLVSSHKYWIKVIHKYPKTSQVITHYLKLGSTRERLEREKLAEENKLLRAKTKAIEEAADMKELYENAIKAMQRYSGHGGDEDEE